MKLPIIYTLCLLFVFVDAASAQERARRKVYPDGSYDEISVFEKEKKFETRSYDTKEKLTKIAVSNLNESGKVMRCAIYSPEGKLRYWEKYAYAEDGRTLWETTVWKPTGELIMKMTREGKSQRVVDATGRVMSESEWKSLR